MPPDLSKTILMLISLKRTIPRSFFIVLLGAALLGSKALAQAQVSLPEDSLPQLRAFIEKALHQSPRMIIRGFDEAASDGDLMYAKSQRLPNVGGFADILKAREDRADFLKPQSADKLYYRVSMTQPLFHWGVISRNVRNAEIRRDVEAGRTRQAFLTMVVEIRGKYLELMLHKKNVERQRFSMQLLDNELQDSIQKRELNTLSEAQLQQMRLKHKRGLMSVGYYEDQYLLAKRMFCRMVGVESISEDEVADEFPQPDFAQDARIAASLLARFAAEEDPSNTELAILQQEMTVRENDLKNTRMSLRPKVNVIAGVTQDEQSYTANVGQRYEFQSIYAGLGFSWTIFDGLATRASVKSTLARIRAAEATYDHRRNRILDDAESIMRQLEYRVLEVEVEDEELVSAQNHLKFVDERFRRGEASENDLAQARLNLLDRWKGTMTARFNYWERMFTFLTLVEADPAAGMLPINSQ